MASDHPREVLKRTLSTQFTASTASTLVEQMSSVTVKDGRSSLQVIGLGTCGSVFEEPGTELAYKKGPDIRSIWGDFGLTNTVYNAVLETKEMLQGEFRESIVPRTPKCYEIYMHR